MTQNESEKLLRDIQEYHRGGSTDSERDEAAQRIADQKLKELQAKISERNGNG